MNLNESMDQFTVAIMSPVKEMAAVERAILETRHFSDPISLFCMVRNQTATDCKLLKDCVKGVTLATRGLDYNILWKGKHNRNYLEVDMDPSFRSDGLVVDPTQKPLDLYKELVVALTTPKQWVIDACSGTGTGCIAALSEGRNVVGLEIDEEMLRHSKLRISKELKPAEEELQGPEEIEVEGMQALNDSREGSIDDTDENIAD
ncbi:hypothetical protein HOLleu_31103 [Holothuria leucospilota]|uniref:DNA methylase N-4/N-6 domain-containing protein n=1 Tax=Holothuria leucospilota TaxID=206669 RepID=A0A9Q1GZW4_HOLLE|nr:hypothetical protein HOLleu_31103 [Holothuria leucospilota]